ncbi:MAG: metallophosphoesterase family protein [Bacteroidales bacterium]|jgi:hypothetical protein|nr:metallophosphoesterase family protein [Bacteroidales bacterium]
MKRCILIFAVLCGCAGFAKQPELKFRADGTFKILQMTDFHFKAADTLSNKALRNINRMLDLEQPDFVALTGDLIYGSPGREGLERLLEPLIRRKIPYAVVWGNHDDHDCDMSRREMQAFVEKQPCNTGFRVNGIDEASESVFNVRVTGSKSAKTALVMWFMDSGTSIAPAEGERGYGWISYPQIEWYNRESRAITKANGGKPVPALAFYHIPVPEYNEAIRDTNSIFIGNKFEPVACPKLNSGFFTATRINGDVMGHFCGHEHDNDFITLWHGIALAYGRFSGGDTGYNHLDYVGGRVILLKEGERKFETYIRLYNGDLIQRAYFPEGTRKIEF